VESRLGLIFPSEYRWFLGRYGAIEGNGAAIFGMSTGTNTRWPSLAFVTESLGRQVNLPHHLLPIYVDGLEVTLLATANVGPWEVGSIYRGWSGRSFEKLGVEKISGSFLDSARRILDNEYPESH
jgi:hypothetical protein